MSKMADEIRKLTNRIFVPLFLIFLVLQLTDLITWSWWWITAPIWGGTAINLMIFGLIVSVKSEMEKRD